MKANKEVMNIMKERGLGKRVGMVLVIWNTPVFALEIVILCHTVNIKMVIGESCII